ncbi:unnamed protein product [Medioppia subpectinata]|nr:unnamed protein product [Medioppia subpectinata]CAG2109076.1 unnamed protein product [Medioppia subpectinata]
MLNIYT